jgi:hypothetical protein
MIGSQMTEVLRYGHHWMPSTVVVTFNQALNLGTAQDAQNYIIKSTTTQGVKVMSTPAAHSVSHKVAPFARRRRFDGRIGSG